MNKKGSVFGAYYQSVELKIASATSLSQLIVRKRRSNYSGLPYKKKNGALVSHKFNKKAGGTE